MDRSGHYSLALVAQGSTGRLRILIRDLFHGPTRCLRGSANQIAHHATRIHRGIQVNPTTMMKWDHYECELRQKRDTGQQSWQQCLQTKFRRQIRISTSKEAELVACPY